MIQRVQSVYLVVAIVMNVILLFAPFMIAESPQGAEPAEQLIVEGAKTLYAASEEGAAALEMNLERYNYLSLSIALLTSFLLLVVIFMFKQRLKQVMFCRLALLLEAAILAAMLLYDVPAAKDLMENAPDDYTYQYGIVFPIIALLFIFMAIRAIMADERLVRSADRIR